MKTGLGGEEPIIWYHLWRGPGPILFEFLAVGDSEIRDGCLIDQELKRAYNIDGGAKHQRNPSTKVPSVGL